MPRLPRQLTALEGLGLHKVWRGHNKEFNLGHPSDKRAYLRFLNDSLEKQPSPLHAFTLMSNHSHELYTLLNQPEFSNFMRRHHTQYGMRFNKKYNRCGKVAQDRPFTCPVENEAYEMEVTFYIHANPLRAKMVKHPDQYIWSTHLLYAYGKRPEGMQKITLPPWYMKLGRSMKQRQKKYRRLFEAYLKSKGLIKIHHTPAGFGSFLWVHHRSITLNAFLKLQNRGP